MVGLGFRWVSRGLARVGQFTEFYLVFFSWSDSGFYGFHAVWSEFGLVYWVLPSILPSFLFVTCFFLIKKKHFRFEWACPPPSNFPLEYYSYFFISKIIRDSFVLEWVSLGDTGL